MKSLTHHLINEFINQMKSNDINIGDLTYVMTYKVLKNFVNTLDKSLSFNVIMHSDNSMRIEDYLNDVETYFYYNDEREAWCAFADDDVINIDEWTLADDDIILLFEI